MFVSALRHEAGHADGQTRALNPIRHWGKKNQVDT
jgi:hypothetical protein